MNRTDKDLQRSRFDGLPEIGWLVGFRDSGQITRGFVREIDGEWARVGIGSGFVRVRLSAIVYRYTKKEA